MAHRDPETGQFVSDSGGSMLSYADHDVQHINHDLDYLATADVGPSATITDVREWDVTARGLDPDEIAELRAIRVNFTLQQAGSPISQDEIGSVRASLDTGYNLAGTEFLSAGPSTTTLDTDSSGTDDARVSFKDTDEVGQLTADQLSATVGFSDTTDGTGGSNGFPQVTYTMPYPGLTGGGPVVDSADGFQTRVELDVNNMVAGIGASARVSLFYAVEEVEGGRSRFGR